MKTYSNYKKLSNDLKNLFENQYQNQNQNESYFDFEIICEQNQISFKTHKSILSSRSQYFKSLFNSKMKEYQENKLILKDVSSSILFSILNYFYSGKIKINLENAVEILIFSSKYLIDELIKICSKFIKNNFQIETVVDILKLSESMNLNQLMNFSYQFISENFEEFIKTPFFLELEENHLNSILSNDFIPLNEFEIFQSITKWGKNKLNINQENEKEKENENEKENEKENENEKEKEKLQDQIANIIHKIRFIDFSTKELKTVLKEDLIPNQIFRKLVKFLILQNDNEENGEELNKFIEKEKEDIVVFKSRLSLSTSSIIQEQEHFNKLKEWINDNDFFSKMKKGFSATRDGFDCENWHKKVDNKGKTLVLIQTNDNFIFGGFTRIGFTNNKSKWKEKDRIRNFGFIPDPYAFIFSLRNDKNNRQPHKFPIKQDHQQYAIYYHSNYGPIFGFNSYTVDFLLKSNLKTGRSNLGYRYSIPNGITYGTNESRSYLAGSYESWIVDEVETYFI
ncbi:pep-cterm sorting domain-containing protein [Anaeramoeba ignava]|uniref:Pep-cterm sorting domain-containing protein n=1 Tax=Anaeramoeba ignava TaxID=1746090 RepID=A0A9Q0LKR0_ANAIG|nr:pep-cterm sorting domain-containing protein [Anaeramoeba ignava]